MNNFPIYHSFYGNKQVIFDGIKQYLNQVNEWYEKNKALEKKLYNELEEIKEEIDKSFNKDLDTINQLQVRYDAKRKIWSDLANDLAKTSKLSFFLDLIKVFG